MRALHCAMERRYKTTMRDTSVTPKGKKEISEVMTIFKSGAATTDGVVRGWGGTSVAQRDPLISPANRGRRPDVHPTGPESSGVVCILKYSNASHVWRHQLWKHRPGSGEGREENRWENGTRCSSHKLGRSYIPGTWKVQTSAHGLQAGEIAIHTSSVSSCTHYTDIMNPHNP